MLAGLYYLLVCLSVNLGVSSVTAFHLLCYTFCNQEARMKCLLCTLYVLYYACGRYGALFEGESAASFVCDGFEMIMRRSVTLVQICY